uniref:Glabrous enhancer-binding protein-like DBD domain-containing protein n=1 Tax=Cucumis melo TaxID=3656 RepID=A0A9I9EJ85_CUCME
MATSFSNADTEDNYLESTTESPQISSFDNSKRGRQEDESWNSQIEEEREISKKIKKNNFLWNWTDQCTILENLYEFAGKNGSYSKELFYHFVKGKLSVEVSYSQLTDKVYRLKKRFILMKANKHNSNYEKLFELSSNIWGEEENPKLSEEDSSGRGLNNAENEFQIALEKLKIDITFIPPDDLQNISKEWEDMMSARNDYELKYAKLLEEISNIRCTQDSKYI